MLQLAFDGFARQATTVFTSSLRTVCSVTLSSIEQRSYAEYIDSLESLTYLTLFSAEPMHNLGVLEIPLHATMTCIDHMLGGPGRPTQPERPLTEIEGGVVGDLIERLLGEMRYSMSGVVPLDPMITGVEYSPQFAQVAGASDVMVVADARAEDQRALLPDDRVPALRRPAPAPGRARPRRSRSPSASAPSAPARPPSCCCSSSGCRWTSPCASAPRTLGPDTLAALAPGDVIRLGHPADAPLDVVVDGKTFAHATAGARGPRLAALIVGTPKENA